MYGGCADIHTAKYRYLLQEEESSGDEESSSGAESSSEEDEEMRDAEQAPSASGRVAVSLEVTGGQLDC